MNTRRFGWKAPQPRSRVPVRPRTWFRVSIGLLACVLATTARAASIEDDLDDVDARTAELAARTTALELDTRPGAYLSNAEAVSRFQDYLFLHLIGEHQPAAEGFFALVTTGALSDAGLHRDAEWYLAESLVGLENYKTAASRFQVIADDAEHPFRDDAVRRLLELYTMSGDKEAFQSLYDREIASGRVKPTGLITYSLAKNFYQQGDLASAKSYFGQVPEGNAWFGRARYFLGTVLVVEQDLPAAMLEFQKVADLSISTTEDRMVHDLALLAMGRISYHTNEYFAASEFYNRIGGDSQYQADKLYEIIWTSIRREKWHDALNNVEIFLLAYPEHEYSAQLRLLQGHLNFQEQNWTGALGAYEQVISDYTPVQARFESLARPESDAEAAVRQVIESKEQDADLPPYAVAMMKADPELSRAIDVFRDLDLERQDIEASERLIDELRSFIDGSGAIGSYERARTDSLTARQSVIETQLEVLGIEERWLGTLDEGGMAGKIGELTGRRSALVARANALSVGVTKAADDLTAFERSMGDIHAEADNARRDAADRETSITAVRADLAKEGIDEVTRAELVTRITTLEGEVTAAQGRQDAADRQMAEIQAPPSSSEVVDLSEMGALHADIDQLARDFVAARPSVPGLVVGDRADAKHRSLDDSFSRLTGVFDGIQANEGTEVTGIRERFEFEVTAVAQERVDYEAMIVSARDVSLEITREGFGRLEDFFADSILKADMGIVDVYWAQKLEVADELQRIREERELQMAELEKRFRLIREKMGEPK